MSDQRWLYSNNQRAGFISQTSGCSHGKRSDLVGWTSICTQVGYVQRLKEDGNSPSISRPSCSGTIRAVPETNLPPPWWTAVEICTITRPRNMGLYDRHIRPWWGLPFEIRRVLLTVFVVTWKLFFSRSTSVHTTQRISGFAIMRYTNLLLTLTLTSEFESIAIIFTKIWKYRKSSYVLIYRLSNINFAIFMTLSKYRLSLRPQISTNDALIQYLHLGGITVCISLRL